MPFGLGVRVPPPVPNERDKMKIDYGNGTTKYGPGVMIKLTGHELAHAVDLFLYSQEIYIDGPRTITYKGKLLESGCKVYVDPSGRVVANGEGFDGRGPEK